MKRVHSRNRPSNIERVRTKRPPDFMMSSLVLLTLVVLATIILVGAFASAISSGDWCGVGAFAIAATVFYGVIGYYAYDNFQAYRYRRAAAEIARIKKEARKVWEEE